ncbi:replicative DNA helicase [candidate division KSB1 bacterium]|nr:MAG: replicative DNA helicase [candidate division KSB1 bacterium]
MAAREKIDNNKDKKGGNVFDRVPPQSIEAEKAVLGSMLLDNDCIGKVVEILEPESFYKTAHRKIFLSCLELYQKNEPIDVITLSENLKRNKILDDVGGAYYLTELSEAVPSSANIDYHVRIVHEKYLLRRLIQESAGIARDCYEAQEDADNIIDRSEQRIFGISDKQKRRGFQSIKEVVSDAFHKIDVINKRGGKVTGIPTGFDKLDELTSGFQTSELIIIAGRPSMGKTAFALNIARNAAAEKFSVGFFSLEMSSDQLAMRLLSAEARIDAHAVRTGKMSNKDWNRLGTNAGKITNLAIYVDDSPGISVLELRAKARRLKKEKNIDMIMIDYLQLMQGPKNSESRQQEISMISRSLKALAKELDVPVVALSQLSRAVETRGGDKRPMLSDLRESGAIEQDADVVLFVYRPEFYMTKEEAQSKNVEGKAEIIIGKQRNGPVGTVNLTFLKRFAKFENYAFDEESVVPF